MKVRQLICVVCAALLALPMLANAEVYKWRDKNGVVRYSDTPPPADVKQEQVGYKKLKTPAATAAPLSPVAPSDKVKSAAPAGSKEQANKEGDNQDAKKRQETAEADKKAKEEKEKNDKIKEENCKVAKSNLAGFKQGGRLFKVDEKGERHYMEDKELKEGAEKAQHDIDENCN